MKKYMKKTTAILLIVTMIGTLAGCQSKKETSKLDPDNPTTVTVWNYYNGEQLTAFEQLVDKFNESMGTEKGINVVSVSQGDINTLADSLIDAVSGKVGAQDIPTIASVYSETAYILNQDDAIVPLDSYFTQDELDQYVPQFLEEGRFNEENELLSFPISKSTEVFIANETDWAEFEKATGVSLASVKTNEDLTAAAKKYYEWTDSLTPDVAEDGKALYGRDSVANYIYIGCKQLGHEIFSVKDGKVTTDLDRDTFKTLWDNYYIPYINGYFGAYAKFRSEDVKMGKILAMTSSSSSTSYLSDKVTLDDDSEHDITMCTTESLSFKDAVDHAVVQQGANFCVMKSTEEQQEGAVEFLKWFTDPAQNLEFSISSGYSPVTKEANTEEAIRDAFQGDESSATGANGLDALLVSAKAYTDYDAYAVKPFNGSKDVRSLLDSILQDTADTDRAAVVAAIEGGQSRKDAVAQYSTEEYFDSWFNNMCDQVNAVVKK